MLMLVSDMEEEGPTWEVPGCGRAVRHEVSFPLVPSTGLRMWDEEPCFVEKLHHGQLSSKRG